MFKTKQHIHRQKIGLWAIPLRQDDITDENRGFPFEFELYGITSHWRTNAIHLGVQEIAVVIKSGIDLLPMALETLELRAQEALETYQKVLAEINEQKNQLMLLSHQPEFIQADPEEDAESPAWAREGVECIVCGEPEPLEGEE